MPESIREQQMVLQLGAMSNMVGTHYWNAQQDYQEDAVRHDVSFIQNGPLLLSENFKGTVPPQESAEERGAPEDAVADLGLDVTVISQGSFPHRYTWLCKCLPVPRMHRNFQALYYNPRSLNTLPRHYFSSSMPFSSFTLGRDVLAEVRDDLLESNLRYFMEACDSLQSFTILADVHDAFSGLAVDVVEYLRDELPKSSILGFGIEAPVALQSQKRGVDGSKINAALALHSLSQLCNVYAPISAPGDLEEYEGSALLASLVESITFPSRTTLSGSSCNLHEITSLVNSTGKTSVASLAYHAGDLPSPPAASTAHKVPVEIPWLWDVSMCSASRSGPEWGSVSVYRRESAYKTEDFEDMLQGYFTTPPNCSRSVPLKTGFPVSGHYFPKQVLPEDGALLVRLASRPEIGAGLVGRAASNVKSIAGGFRVGGGDGWSSSTKSSAGKQESCGVSSSQLLASYSGGNHGLGREDFADISEALFELAQAYEF